MTSGLIVGSWHRPVDPKSLVQRSGPRSEGRPVVVRIEV